MGKQLPGWLSTLLVLVATFGIIGIIARSQPVRPAAQAEVANDSLAARNLSAPDFSGPTLDGKTFKLSDQKGKVVLVNFWATWCGPCRMEIPDLINLQKKYGSRGFTVVGVAQDDPEKMAAFVAQSGMNYPVMVAPEDAERNYGVTALPSSVLVDKKGKIIYAMRGIDPEKSVEAVWSEQIEKAL